MWGWQFANLKKEVWLGYWRGYSAKTVKVRFYKALYTILRIAHSALHFTSLTDLFN